jgi:hypothetical protein
LLNFEKPIVLTPQKVIEFFVQAPDFQLGFQVDFVIVFAAQSRGFDVDRTRAGSTLHPVLAGHCEVPVAPVRQLSPQSYGA